jgi:hypothetical protein
MLRRAQIPQDLVGATQAIRMQNLDQRIVTFLLIHQLDR